MSQSSWTESGPSDGESVREWKRSIADRVRTDILDAQGVDAIPELQHLRRMVAVAMDSILCDPEEGCFDAMGVDLPMAYEVYGYVRNILGPPVLV